MTRPFLKWPGGKNWFVKSYAHLMPTEFQRYIDPFLGGGSIFFHLEPNGAIISDSNQELILTYRAIRDHWGEVNDLLQIHKQNHSKEYYYNVRNERPAEISEMAARMIYLNRTCFNGIYRVNRNGVFNVPIGTRDSILFEYDHFEQKSELLRRTEIISCDFEETINRAGRNDLLFCDPPYTVFHDNNGFIKYNERLFLWTDQVRLANAIHRAKERGVKILVTNADHEAIRDLYADQDYSILEISRYSSISGKKESRSQYHELIVSANIL